MADKAKIGTLTPQQVRKRIKLTKRRHKLYVRGSNGMIRKLDNISRDLYDTVLVLFLKGDGEKRYAMLNEGVEHWSGFKPVQLPLKQLLHAELFSLNKALGLKKNSSVEVSYNGSWKPLVNLYIKDENIAPDSEA